MTRGCICIWALVLLLFGGPVASQTDVVSDNITDSKKKLEPIASVTCKVTEPTIFSMHIDGSAEELFSLTIRDCRYSMSLTGVITVRTEVQIDLNVHADVQACQVLRLVHLLELASGNADFEWRPRRVLIDDLSLTNLADQVYNISFFELHDQLFGKPVKLGSVLNGSQEEPNYSDLFWADFVVFEDLDGAEFSRLLSSKLPAEGSEAGKADYTLELNLKSFVPRASCTYKQEVTQGDAVRIETISKALRPDRAEN